MKQLSTATSSDLFIALQIAIGEKQMRVEYKLDFDDPEYSADRTGKQIISDVIQFVVEQGILLSSNNKNHLGIVE
jgi:hypothetical protein